MTVTGEKYATEGHLDVAEIAKRMRSWIKTARKLGQDAGGIDLPEDAKVSVRIDRYSMGQSVDVTITAPAAWVHVAPGAPEGPEYRQQPAHGGYTLAAQVAEALIEHELQSYNRRDIDSMTDLYNVWFSGHVKLAVAGTDYGRLRIDPSMPPVAIGSTVDRFDARDAIRRTPMMIADDHAEALAEDARRTAGAQAAAAQVEAEAAEIVAGDPAAVAVAQEQAEVFEAAAALAARLDEAERAATAAVVDEAVATAAMAAQPSSYRREGRDGRTITARWVLTTDEQGRPVEVADLSVHHFGRSGYRALLNRVTVNYSESTGVVGELSSPMDAVEVCREPAARYSQKAHKAFTRRAVAVVLDPANRDRFVGKFLAGQAGHKR